TYDGETEMIEELERGLLGERLGEILSTLPERMRRVIEMRFGLGQREGEGPRSLRQIAQELDLSKERIRQIESKALEEMRHPDHSRELRDFLDDPAVIEGAPADKQ
ncbi:MAG TPA: sigma-70 family RNA polymerase sigma factor, partial [Dehalococcoidales bacterium]|nr:sigma-70 family RNA polymerase sigma factor [Dehalococcoidales bacterium]